MKNLLLGLCVVFSSLVFGQEDDDDTIYYSLYHIKTMTMDNDKLEKVRIIEYDPTPEYFVEEKITKWDTIGVLSFIGKQVVDSLNKLRGNIGLLPVKNDNPYIEDEYGYIEESIFDYLGRVQKPLMVTNFYYDMGECTCVNEIISEITSHKDIMKRVLSKRNKVLNVSIILDKKTNMYYTYIQVKRLFTISYYIG
jgi:hypothetical protein